MGLASSARAAFIGATALIASSMPFNNAEAQSRAANNSRPAAAAPSTRMGSSPVLREVDAMLAASDYSKDGKAVGILIALNDAVRAKGVTPAQVGQPIVDSLNARGIKSKYFYLDSPSGASSGISIFISASPYVNSQGKYIFTPVSIRQEYGYIIAEYMTSQLKREIASKQNNPSLNKD